MIRGLWVVWMALVLAGCATQDDSRSDFASATAPTVGAQYQYSALAPTIAQEPPGNYYIGRRFHRKDYFYWGYIRRPGQPWKDAKLVMLNEHQRLAPDRALGRIGYDHNFEYRLTGYFSGDTVYEAASNSFFPEFVLTGYEKLSENPPPLFNERPVLRGARPR